MKVFVRKQLQRIDVLECEDEELRTGFVDIAKTIGRLKGSNSETVAHILHLRPLLLGAVTEESNGIFYPESPNAYDRSSNCTVLDRHSESGYSIFQCQEIDNAALVLSAAYPKVSFEDQDKEKTIALGYSNGQKAVDIDNNLQNSIRVLPDSPKIFSIKGKDGTDYPVDTFEKLYEKNVWPTAKIHSSETRSHFFTYFRELEVKYDRPHSGTFGTRYRHLSRHLYLELYRSKAWNYLKSFLSSLFS